MDQCDLLSKLYSIFSMSVSYGIRVYGKHQALLPCPLPLCCGGYTGQPPYTGRAFIPRALYLFFESSSIVTARQGDQLVNVHGHSR